jgi:hypothetical protein
LNFNIIYPHILNIYLSIYLFFKFSNFFDKSTIQIYQPVSPITVKQDIIVSSLVNKLLVDIYGLTSDNQTRSGSESINSSLRLRQYCRPHLHRNQLELKCKNKHKFKKRISLAFILYILFLIF